ncbi:hypothetical protein [Angustibacter luteus]|uniref:Helicase n=1 Tax=Angustibacter luteus TaxID=658456 RepID=A0ABW1JH13_9ACTN
MDCADQARGPDDAPCWAGHWSRVEPLQSVWAQAALVRTVGSLPRLHAWRLGDAKGSSRQLQWVAQLAGSPAPIAPLGVLAVTATQPRLDHGDGSDVGDSVDLAMAVGSWAVDALTGALNGLATRGTNPQWAGAMVRLPGSWLPPMAWLPRDRRGGDDPGTAWPTESVEVARRYTLHCAELRTMAALLTPAVLALALDAVPAGSAVTVAGDALHVWWPYSGDALRQVGRVARAGRAARLIADAFPAFVLADFPDRSGEVEADLAERQSAADAYRASRRPGASVDPVMQRIYDQARAAYDAGHPSP